ncbi:MAG: saccharopine dehydrogenase NADP-binding domain-containing protein [Candidatus Marinimicrobia bacterium]|nr:saccharopine dehydrogenase NADP-binding domain-containing protein [Candidatus Neomarinimicrobiota bacterium]
MYKNILILGGYGNTGGKIALILLQHSDVNVTLAGRNITKANALTNELNNQFNTDRRVSTVSNSPYQILLQLEAAGIKEGEPEKIKIQLSHYDGYWFTAIPVMACLNQYLDGSIKKPGLHIMGHLVDPARLMKDMQRMGITINEEKT